MTTASAPYCMPLAGLPGVYLETGRMCTTAVHARADRPLAVEWPPAGAEHRWTVSQWWGNDQARRKYTTAAEARAALIRAAAAALAALPPCGRTHDEHLAAWRSWRDDCVDPETGCGFAMRDVDQCERGHPDDGTTFCGACGLACRREGGRRRSCVTCRWTAVSGGSSGRRVLFLGSGPETEDQQHAGHGQQTFTPHDLHPSCVCRYPPRVVDRNGGR